jgi:hypothetical protein
MQSLCFNADKKLKKILFMTALFLPLLMLLAAHVLAHEFSGYVAAEGRFFFNDPLFPEQERNSFSLSFQPEYYHEWKNGSSFTFVPFARLDGTDSERSHFDIRELNFLWLGDAIEMRVGVGKVFWGVTEFVHLVDIINQTDLVENIDGEDKLGQPMIHLSFPKDWGVIDLFVLPYFRERTFPGSDGRLRSSLIVDTDNATYESGDKEHHIDFAVRYSHSLGDWDLGVYNFSGTGREPSLLVDLDDKGNPVLIPHYEQINQAGIDLQFVAGEWLWKLEALYRTGQGEDFFATVGGFEYTFVSISDTSIDLSIIGELAYDDRGSEATTTFQKDALLGLRINLNDAASSELLFGMSQDMDNSSNIMSIEASRRFGNNIKASLEARIFLNQSEGGFFYSLRNDDLLQLEIAYYF